MNNVYQIVANVVENFLVGAAEVAIAYPFVTTIGVAASVAIAGYGLWRFGGLQQALQGRAVSQPIGSKLERKIDELLRKGKRLDQKINKLLREGDRSPLERARLQREKKRLEQEINRLLQKDDRSSSSSSSSSESDESPLKSVRLQNIFRSSKIGREFLEKRRAVFVVINGIKGSERKQATFKEFNLTVRSIEMMIQNGSIRNPNNFNKSMKSLEELRARYPELDIPVNELEAYLRHHFLPQQSHS